MERAAHVHGSGGAGRDRGARGAVAGGYGVRGGLQTAYGAERGGAAPSLGAGRAKRAAAASAARFPTQRASSSQGTRSSGLGGAAPRALLSAQGPRRAPPRQAPPRHPGHAAAAGERAPSSRGELRLKPRVDGAGARLPQHAGRARDSVPAAEDEAAAAGALTRSAIAAALEAEGGGPNALVLRDAALTGDCKLLGACAPRLRSLDVSQNPLLSLCGLDRLKELRELRAFGCAVASLAEVGRCRELRELCLQHNAVAQLAGVEGLGKLLALRLAGNELESSSGLQRLTALQRLDLSQNRLTRLAGMQQLHSLVQLDVSHNAIATLDGLQLPPNVEELNLCVRRCGLSGCRLAFLLCALPLWCRASLTGASPAAATTLSSIRQRWGKRSCRGSAR